MTLITNWSPRVSHNRRPLRIIVLALVVLVSLLTAACADRSQQGESNRKDATETEPSANAVIGPLRAQQWRKMQQAGMLRPECPIVRRSQLRTVSINHFDFQGNVRRGTVVVNTDVAESMVRILTRLFDAKFPIRRMSPVESFAGDANKSLRADNTSAYNCRRADQINAPFSESPHANGRAIDINPRENPWMDLRCRCWFPSAKEQARDDEPGKIYKRGLVWRTFRAEGWIWQDIDVADYMHFDTGYPSRPFVPPGSDEAGPKN